MFAFQQDDVSSANFVLRIGLTVLAFAYLAGITSINGAIIAGMLPSAAVIVDGQQAYFFAGANIDNYTADHRRHRHHRHRDHPPRRASPRTSSRSCATPATGW